jgi:hypothetical protein
VTFGAAAFAGLLVLLGLFWLGIAEGIDILFYRGVLLCALAFVVTIVLVAWIGRRCGRVSSREAIAAGFLSLGLNLSALVIVPVTLDRSVSIFILGYMASHPDESFTTEEIEAALHHVYLGRLNQVERRLREQSLTGNIIHSERSYMVSPQGLAFVAFARRIGWLFDVDSRLMSGDVPTKSAATKQGGEGGSER